MWPRTLPPDVTANTLRSTECEVYRRLRRELGNSFVVFYSRPWLGLKEDGEEIDGECDFVVAHAELGLLTLEVKGGAVAYDPRNERWTSRDRWNVTHNIKNPVHQARSAKHQLLMKLNQSPHWRTRWIRARHGVVLPHSAAPRGDLGADMPQRIFCFSETFARGFGDWIRGRLGHGETDRNTRELGRDGLRALEKVLARPFQLRVPLGATLSRDDAVLESVTQQQLHILRGLEAVPRAAIAGAAGTGKTVLAVEEASRLAEKGLRTLYVCYNRGLAGEVRGRIGDGPPVAVSTFHGLCVEMAGRAGFSRPAGVNERQLFEDVWPELLMDAFERLPGETYDAVVVDEGQDFLPLWWTAIDSGLSSGGPLRIFYDNNQRVYTSAANLPEEVELVPIRLTLNLRNTRRIHDLVRKHYEGHEIEAVGPEGVDVRWVNVDSPDRLPRNVSDSVARLHSVERVPTGDIAVLAATDAIVQLLAPRDRLAGFATVRCDQESGGRIVVDTIRRFKGLERQVVVVAATGESVIDKELPYVALSRARTHLVVAGEPKVLDRMRCAVTVG